MTVDDDVQHNSPFGAYAADTNPVVAAVMPPDGVYPYELEPEVPVMGPVATRLDESYENPSVFLVVVPSVGVDEVRRPRESRPNPKLSRFVVPPEAVVAWLVSAPDDGSDV